MMIHPDKTGESGQALLELAIASIGLLTVMLAVIFFGGYALSNVRMLLGAKQNAEVLANNSSEGGAGANIGSWTYGEVPFTAQDRHTVSATDLKTFSNAFDDENYSNADNDNYTFATTGDFGKVLTTTNRNYTVPDYAVSAANLLKGSFSGSTADNMLLKSGKHVSAQELKKIKMSFFNLIQVTLDENNLANIPANCVFLPAMQVRQ